MNGDLCNDFHACYNSSGTLSVLSATKFISFYHMYDFRSYSICFACDGDHKSASDASDNLADGLREIHMWLCRYGCLTLLTDEYCEFLHIFDPTVDLLFDLENRIF